MFCASYLPKILLQYEGSPFIDDPDLIKATENLPIVGSLHPFGSQLCVAFGRRVVVLPCEEHTHPIHFTTVTGPPEVVTCIEYMRTKFEGQQSCIILGTSRGFIQIHAEDGSLLHRQDCHTSPLTSIHLRKTATESIAGGMGTVEDISFGFEDGVIVVQAIDILSTFQWAVKNGDAPDFELMKWVFPRLVGKRSFSACIGPARASLYDMIAMKKEKYRNTLLSVGRDPPVAFFEVEHATKKGVMSIVSSLLTSTLLSRKKKEYSKEYALEVSDEGGTIEERLGSQVESRKNVKSHFVYNPVSAVWDDSKRNLFGVKVCPSGAWAASCDTLGRIVLMDLQSRNFFRMIKGYREAQIAWFQVDKDQAIPLLLIYAPKRTTFEAWDVLHGSMIWSTTKGVPAKGILFSRFLSRGSTEESNGIYKVLLFNLENSSFTDFTQNLVQLAHI